MIMTTKELLEGAREASRSLTEYTNEQILNYKEQSYPVLVESVDGNRGNHVNYISEKCRWN